MMHTSFLFLGFVLIGATEAKVNVTGEWIPRSGWKVTCSWHTMMNDPLQSVRLYRNDRQYFVFRPELSGPLRKEEIPTPTYLIMTECRAMSPQTGHCVTKLIVGDPESATEDIYTCEVSGERPMFREERGFFDAYVPPSEPVVTRITQGDTEVLNCSSEGLPSPRLVWTVDGRKIPADFESTSWDPNTKLWTSWSSYRPHQTSVVVTCRPEVIRRNGLIVTGVATNSAETIADQWQRSSGWTGRYGTAGSLIVLISLLIQYVMFV